MPGLEIDEQSPGNVSFVVCLVEEDILPVPALPMHSLVHQSVRLAHHLPILTLTWNQRRSVFYLARQG